MSGYSRRSVSSVPQPRKLHNPRIRRNIIHSQYYTFHRRGFPTAQTRHILESHGVRTVFRSDSTLRNQLVRPKDPVHEHRPDGIVYNIPCQRCDGSYICETARPIAERITEHKRDVRLQRTDSSTLAEHAWEKQHQLDYY